MLKLKNLKPIHIAQYKEHLSEDLKLSPKTIERKLSSLRKFLGWAKKNELTSLDDYLNASVGQPRQVGRDSTQESRLLEIEGLSVFSASNPPPKEDHNISDDVNRFVNITRWPIAKKVLFHLQYSRPKWYKKYHTIPVVHYLHFAILVIFVSFIAFGLYQQLFGQVPTPFAYPGATTNVTPNRIISFQGRLTDTSGNPISSATDMRFAIYNSVSATGAAQLWEELRYVDPDGDGIFNILLGQNVSISSTIFSENADLWLGVTVDRDAEADPRQRIATVPYALNAETLQGHPPSASVSANQIPVMTQNGDFYIAQANPRIYSASGGFKVEGQTLTFETESNGNISIAPDGTGRVLVTSQNTSSNTFDVQNSAITVGNLIYGYAGNDNSGYNLLRLTSGSSEVNRFLVDQSGNTSASGDLIVGAVDTTPNISTTNMRALTIGNSTTGAIVLAPGATTALTAYSNDVTIADTLSVSGNTIGLNNDADANNLLGIAAAGGVANTDLFWGNDLVCDVSETNCGWATSATSYWTRVAGNIYPATVNDTVSATSSAATVATFTASADNAALLLQSGATAADLLILQSTGGVLTDAIDASDETITNALNVGPNTITGTTYTITAGTALSLGEGTPTVAITSSDWTINTTGDMTNIGAIGMDGDLTITSATPSIFLVDTGGTSDDYSINNNADVFSIDNDTAGRSELSFIAGDGSINLGDNTATKNIDIGGVTDSAADTISIATHATAADTITIGNAHASTTIALTGGNDWSITGAGVAVFGSTLSVYGTTIGLNNDADANNLLGIAAAGGVANTDLFWGNDLVCDVSEVNCGLSTILWQRALGVLSPQNITDDLLIGAIATPSSTTANYFQIFGTGSTAGDATSSGILTLGTNRSTAIIETERMLPLTIGSSSTGAITLDGNSVITLSDPTAASSTLTVTGTLTANGTLDANGQVDLGDAGETVTITSNDWTINTTGDMTNIGAIGMDGDLTITQATPTISMVDSGGDDYTVNVDANAFTIINGTDTRTELSFAGDGSMDIGDNTATKTIDIGGVTASAADTVSIATNATAADIIAIGNSHTSTTLALTGGDDWSINTAGLAILGSTLSVYGNTIGLNNDADANNLIGIAAAAGVANTDLFWGNDLMCDVSETNCGWATSATSYWTRVAGNVYPTTLNDTISATSSAATVATFTQSDSTKLALRAGGSTDATTLNVLGSGNVGIGTTAPSTFVRAEKDQNALTSLSVSNATADTAAWTNVSVEAGNSSGSVGAFSSAYTTLNSAVADSFRIRSNSAASAGLNLVTGMAAQMGFWIGDVEKMRIASDGNVGIGTTAPTEALMITGNASMSGTLTVGQGDTIRPEYGPLQLAYKSGLNAWTVGIHMNDVNGNVGIGTTAPGQNLTVSSSSNLAIRIEKPGFPDNFDFGITSHDAYINYTAGTSTNSDLYLRTNGNNVVTLTDTGSVGIGTTGPDSPLDVLSTGGTQLRLSYADGGASTTFNTDTSGNLTIDASGTKTVIADDLQVTGNDIYDSAAATRLTLGATTTITATTTALTGDLSLTTASSNIIVDTTDLSGAEGLQLDYAASDPDIGPAVRWSDGTLANTIGLYITSGLVFQGNTSNQDFRIYTFTGTGDLGTEVIHLDGSTNGNTWFNTGGNVGIGVTAPGTLLNIAGENESIRITDTRNITWAGDEQMGALEFYSDDASAPGVRITASIKNIQNAGANVSPAGSLAFYTAATGATETEKVRIDSSGNVGIATTSPGAKLEVRDDESAAESSIKTTLAANAIVIDTDYTVDNFMPGIVWNTADNNDGKPKLGIWGQETGTGSYMRFGTSNTYATGITNTAMTIDPGGNVGIGITAPATRLDVDTGSNILGIRVRGTAETTEIGDIYVASAGQLVLSTANTGDTGSYIEVDAEDDEYGLIIRDSNTGVTDFANLYLNSATVDYLNIVTGATNATVGLVVDASQQVGIGVTNPTEALMITGNASMSGTLTVGQGDTIRPEYGPLQLAYKSGLNAWTAGITLKDISGNVGIGVTDPINKLVIDVNSSSTTLAASNLLNVANSDATTNNMSGILFNQAAGNPFGAAIVGVHQDRTAGNRDTDLAFYTMLSNTMSEQVRILNNGNVGIGSTVPATKLEVNGTVSVAQGSTYTFVGDTNTNMYRLSTDILCLQANGQEGLCVDGTSGGAEVGILTNAPSRSLHVAGTARITTSVAVTDTLTLCTDVNGDIEFKSGACTVSSLRYKENIDQLSYGLDEINMLNPVFFNYKNFDENNPGGRTKRRIGFIAEEVAQIIPEIVLWDEEGQVDSVDYPYFTSLLTKGIQELDVRTKDLTNLVSNIINASEVNVEDKLISPVIETQLLTAHTIKTDLIRPISDDVEIQGNTSVAGTLTAENIKTEDASISGTLYAQRIVSDEVVTQKLTVVERIQEVIRQIVTEDQTQELFAETSYQASNSGTLSYDQIIALINEANQPDQEYLPSESFGDIDANSLSLAQNMYVFGQTNLADAFVTGTITQGLTFQITGGNSINVLNGTLYLQNLGGPLDLMAGKITIDSAGNTHFVGNVTIAGNLNVKSIKTDGEDLSIDLSSTQSGGFGGLLVKGNIKNEGNLDTNKLTATEASISGQLIADSLKLSSDLSATNSGLIIAASQTASESGILAPSIKTNGTTGVGILPAGETEVVVFNNNVSNTKLIYLTPTSETLNKVLYVKAKKQKDEDSEGFFVVALDTVIDRDVLFNWWIIN